jgi:hypothetical protein
MVLAMAIKLIERANSRQNQRIDVIENFRNRLTEAATTAKAAILSTKPAGASTIDGAGAILIGGKDLVTTYFVDST